jgi:GrpB-like predicted nucleotidyltransferase (UPF0157 family)
MHQKVVVVPYDPSWPDMFQEEAENIRPVFGDEVIAIYHMGSTSIPGLNAKPVIDLLVEVNDIEKIDALNEAFAALNYEARGEYGIPGRRFFTKFSGDERTHNVHIFERGHPEVDRQLVFRDYLRTHPDDAEAYGRLKEKLAVHFHDDLQGYVQAKGDFVREIDRRAEAWKAEKKVEN